MAESTGTAGSPSPPGTAAGPGERTASVPFLHRLSVRQMAPILTMLLVALMAVLLLGYLYAREQILAGTRAQVAQLAASVTRVETYFKFWVERNAAPVVEILHEQALTLWSAPDTEPGAGPEDGKEAEVHQLVTKMLLSEPGQRDVVVHRQMPDGQVRLTRYIRTDGTVSITDSTESGPVPPAMSTPAWAVVPEEGKNALLRYSVPLFSAGTASPEACVGVLEVNVDLPWLTTVIERMAFFQGSLSFILTSEGVFAAPPQPVTSATLPPLAVLAEAAGYEGTGPLEKALRAGEYGDMPLLWQHVPMIALYMPVSTGESRRDTLGLAVLIPEEALLGRLHTLSRILLLLGAGSLLIAGFSLHRTTTVLLRPLDTLSRVAGQLARGDFSQNEQASDAAGTDGLREDEPGRLMRLAGRLRQTLKARSRELTLMARTRERLLGELALARRILDGLRPASLPQCPGLDTAARMLTARDVCGDLYDCFLLRDEPDGELCCVLGDVAGRGIPAALMMNRVMPLLRENLLSGHSPGEALGMVNRTLMACPLPNSAEAPLFVNVFAGVLHPRTGRLVWASAGQPPPTRLFAGQATPLDWSGEIPLGLRQTTYHDNELQLRPGEALFFCSDGLPDLPNLPDADVSAAPCLPLLCRHTGDMASLLDAVSAHVRERVGADGVEDDIVLLAIRWFGPWTETLVREAPLTAGQQP